MKETVEYRASSPNDLLIFALRDVSHVMHVLYEGKGSQKRVLMVLQELGAPITQRDLTERLGIRPASASEVIASSRARAASCARPARATGGRRKSRSRNWEKPARARPGRSGPGGMRRCFPA